MLGKETKCRMSTPNLTTPNLQHSLFFFFFFNHNQLFCSAQYVAALRKFRLRQHLSFVFLFLVLLFFHLLIFLRCSYKEEELIAVASMPKSNLSNSHSDNMSNNANRKCWMCLSARLQCRELLPPWAPKNLNADARRGDYQNGSHTPSASLTCDVALCDSLSMNYPALESGKQKAAWNPFMRCSDIWSKLCCNPPPSPQLTPLQIGLELKWGS